LPNSKGYHSLHLANMDRFTPLVILCLATLVQSTKVDSQPSAKDVSQEKYNGHISRWYPNDYGREGGQNYYGYEHYCMDCDYYHGCPSWCYNYPYNHQGQALASVSDKSAVKGAWWYSHYCMNCMMNDCPSWCYSWNYPRQSAASVGVVILPDVQVDADDKSGHFFHHHRRHGGGWGFPDHDGFDRDWDHDRDYDRDFYDDDDYDYDYHYCFNCNQRNCPHWCYDQDDWDYERPDGRYDGPYDEDYEYCMHWDCQRNECPRWCYEDERIHSLSSAVAIKSQSVAKVDAKAAWWYSHYCMNCMMNNCPSWCYSWNYPYQGGRASLAVVRTPQSISMTAWHNMSPYEHRGWYPRDDYDYDYDYDNDGYDYDDHWDYNDHEYRDWDNRYNDWGDCQQCRDYRCPHWCFGRRARLVRELTQLRYYYPWRM